MVIPKPEELKDFSSFEDHALIKLIAAKQPEALEVLFKRHAGRIFDHIYRTVADTQLAEDLTIEVFLRVWETARQYPRERETVGEWLDDLQREHTPEARTEARNVRDHETQGGAGEEERPAAGTAGAKPEPALLKIDLPASVRSRLMHEVKRRKSILLER